MVENLKKAADAIIREKGEIRFLGIFMMDEYTDKWSVVFSADWISDDNMDESFFFIADQMRLAFNADELSQISRVGLYTENEHLIDLLLKFKEGSRLMNEQVNGNIIHDGYVIISNPKNISDELVYESIVKNE